MTSLIRVIDCSLQYRIRHGAAPTLKDALIKTVRRESLDIKVPALDRVSFQVQPGDFLAVLGRNGAGKSSLLKLLAQVIPPTSGRIVSRGRVAPMIELGAGFHGDLSGRENAVLYGALLGRDPKFMQGRVEEIFDWADLSEAIELPVRTYSSGMIAKLAFAIATDQKTDILLLDEILSVGDESFQSKSRQRIDELFGKESAVIFVTHDANAVRDLATKALWLDHGRVMEYGEVDRVLDAYLNA